MSNSYKKGDLVVLKSGGPVMTIKSDKAGSSDSVYAQWFSGKKLEQGSFPVESLDPAPQEKGKY